MAKRTASNSSAGGTAAPPLYDHLAGAAQQQLAALRGDLETRLAVLEEVLADPSRGESLAGLILDLSRVATEEAQAAAAQACLATRAAAESEVAELRASAKAALEATQDALRVANAALEQEQAVSADLRRGLEQAQLAVDQQAEQLADRERLESELGRQQAIAADLQRAANDAGRRLDSERAEAQKAYDALAAELARERQTAATRERALAERQTELDAEREAGAKLRGAVERAETRSAAFEAECASLRAAHDAAVADLAREREASVARERAREQLQAELDAERAAVVELRQAVQRATELTATIDDATARGHAAQGEAAAELARLQAELERAQTMLAEAEADLEAEQASSADLRRSAEVVDQQLASARSSEVQALASLDAVTAERDAIAGELKAARQWIDEMRAAEAEFGMPAPQAAPPAPPAPAGKGPSPGAGEDEGWQAVRLASRYMFNDGVAVQVNGDPGKLFDLSISGCQLFASSPLKPNQAVKVQLPASPAPVSCLGKVVWTRLEAAAGRQPGYRAGVRFTKADEEAIESFAARHGAAV